MYTRSKLTQITVLGRSIYEWLRGAGLSVTEMENAATTTKMIQNVPTAQASLNRQSRDGIPTGL